VARGKISKKEALVQDLAINALAGVASENGKNCTLSTLAKT
jgi:hypothetical protein